MIGRRGRPPNNPMMAGGEDLSTVRVDETDDEPVPRTARKERLHKNASQRNPQDLPKWIVDQLKKDGIDLQWNNLEVLGEPTSGQQLAYMRAQGWEPVTPDMWGGILEGVYTLKGYKGEIRFGGQVLDWRPMYMTEEARAEERQDQMSALAAQANMIKNGSIPGFSSGFEPGHPQAVSKNVFTREVKPPTEISS